jgi:hypothetical protein
MNTLMHGCWGAFKGLLLLGLLFLGVPFLVSKMMENSERRGGGVDLSTGKSAIRSHIGASYAGARIMAMSDLITVGRWDYRLVRIEGRNALGGFVVKEMVAQLSGSTLISLMEKDLEFRLLEEELGKLSGQAQAEQREQLDALRYASVYALE